MKTCVHCGAEFQAQRSDRKYCGQKCKNNAYNAQRKADGRIATFQASYADRFVEYRRDNHGRWHVDRTCVVCSKVWRTHRKDAKYCSQECYGDATRDGLVPRRSTSRRVLAKRKLTKAAKGTRSKNAWAQGNCHWCGLVFVARVFSAVPRYCTDRCKNLSKSERRRVLKSRGQYGVVRRWEVFERDGWQCQLCGDPLDRESVAPEPWSPSIDHVVPLARGGAHSMSNVQSAHFRCNVLKSDTLVVQPVPATPEAA